MNGAGEGVTAAVLAIATIRSWLAGRVGERVTISVSGHHDEANLSNASCLTLVTRLGSFEADGWRGCISVELPELPASSLRIDPGRIVCADVVADGRCLLVYNNDATTIRFTA